MIQNDLSPAPSGSVLFWAGEILPNKALDLWGSLGIRGNLRNKNHSRIWCFVKTSDDQKTWGMWRNVMDCITMYWEVFERKIFFKFYLIKTLFYINLAYLLYIFYKCPTSFVNTIAA